MLHYASPPTVGGVEFTMLHHALVLADLGYPVNIVTGAGVAFDPRIKTYVEPLFGSRHPAVLRAKQALDTGEADEAFNDLVAQMLTALHTALDDCEVVIAHNVPTLNKNLPLTAALHRYTEARPTLHLIAWTHDLAWTNPQYLPELHDAYPWNLMRTRWPRADYVTVSEPRRVEVAELLGMPPDDVTVIVPGVDPVSFYAMTPTTRMLTTRLDLLDADGLLLLPARLTRRKNIALALRVLAEMIAQTGRDYRVIVTGPPGPHNPTNMGYLGELLELRAALGLEEKAHFLYAYGEGDAPLIPDNDTMANLYHLCDALFFPSTQEGFGIPILEAAFAGLPIFCSDIPPFRATGGEDVAVYFDPEHEPPPTIARRILTALEANTTHRMRVRVRRTYRWESVVRAHLVPLIERNV
ncbi:MAG: hypothetical protein OHK0046_42790 [Anaerolineae bacterium]